MVWRHELFHNICQKYTIKISPFSLYVCVYHVPYQVTALFNCYMFFISLLGTVFWYCMGLDIHKVIFLTCITAPIYKNHLTITMTCVLDVMYLHKPITNSVHNITSTFRLKLNSLHILDLVIPMHRKWLDMVTACIAHSTLPGLCLCTFSVSYLEHVFLLLLFHKEQDDIIPL